MTTVPHNPFLLNGYQGPALFCDREFETKQIISNALNGVNTTLLSIRRMGKTGLLHHVIHNLHQKKKGRGIYVDIYDTENMQDFVNKLATAMLQSFPPKHKFLTQITSFLNKLRPTFTYNELTGLPEVMLSFQQAKQYEHTLQSIFSFLDAQDQLILITIDEFQQILAYPEKNIEATLRTYVQALKNVRFVFSGSSPHLLAEMFSHAKRPFFASTQILELNEIEHTIYKKFIVHAFKKYERAMYDEAVEFVLNFSKHHTYYVQLLCNKLFSIGEDIITLQLAQNTANDILKQNEVTYHQYRTMLTSNQWTMLKAIAKEDKLYQPGSKEFSRKYQFGSSSIVQRSIESLLQKELIYVKIEHNDKYYCVYDCFLSRWLSFK